MSLRTRRAPSPANRWAVARPIPLPAPVMIATLPSSLIHFLSRSRVTSGSTEPLPQLAARDLQRAANEGHARGAERVPNQLLGQPLVVKRGRHELRIVEVVDEHVRDLLLRAVVPRPGITSVLRDQDLPSRGSQRLEQRVVERLDP